MNELDPEVPADKYELRWQSRTEFPLDYEYAKGLMVSFCGLLRAENDEEVRKVMIEVEETFQTFLVKLNACTNRKDRHLQIEPRNVLRSLLG